MNFCDIKMYFMLVFSVFSRIKCHLNTAISISLCYFLVRHIFKKQLTAILRAYAQRSYIKIPRAFELTSYFFVPPFFHLLSL
jgi:hypothetical protein